jgi:putative urate catabolism protein
LDLFPPRDLKGYGDTPPNPLWPNSARIAVQFVINYEEGGEYSLVNGDTHSESFLSEIVGAERWDGMRHMNMESLYEYGSRAGFYRLHEMFSKRSIPATVFAVARALELNPDIVEPMKKSGWEIASHGYRWIDYHPLSIDEEREHMKKAIEIHTKLTGERPLGWYTGRSSVNSRKLVTEEGGFTYDADSYADDLPYWDKNYAKPQLVVPYTLDTNDMRFLTSQGFNSGDQFFAYLKDSFDYLYEEGATSPKMLSIGIHCRISGRPGRAAALTKFLDYVKSHDQVWMATRLEIAEHWIKNH